MNGNKTKVLLVYDQEDRRKYSFKVLTELMFSSQAHCGNHPNRWKNARSSLLKFLNIDGTWATTTARQMIEKDLT